MRSQFATSPTPNSVHARSGRIVVIVLFLILFTGASGFAWWKFKGSKFRQEATGPVLHTVATGPFDHVVLEQGEIESSSNVEVKCKVKARGQSGTAIIWVIDEGSYVKEGDELVRLDSSALEQEMKVQRIAVNSAEAAGIASDAALKQAMIAREEYLKGTFLTERTAIMSEISLNQQELRKAELSLASAERLAAKGSLKSLQIEAEQFAVQNARNKLEAAGGRLKVLDELTKAKMLVQFDSDIETARAKLEADQSSLIEEKSKLAEIEAQIKACLITSPKDGQVVYANKYSGRGGSEFLVEAGAMVREQQTVIVLPDPTKMQVKAKINESKITLVSEGMAAKIKLSAVDGDLLGKIEKVNKYAEQGSWFSSAVKEYATYVQIIDPPPTIRTGMTAEVRIFVEQLPDAIQVPVHAIHEVKGHHFALVKAGDRWDTREIKLGATNEKFVTIQEGLKAGEQVALNPRQHLALMEIPDIEDVVDREKLVAIGKAQADGPSKVGAAPDAGTEKTAAGGAKAPGAGPAGGFDPKAIADMMLKNLDTDSDGKISADEASSSEQMKSGFPKMDLNGDGFVDAGEIGTSIKKRMQQAGAAGGPPGAPRS
jgi:HlyD family secretion protein